MIAYALIHTQYIHIYFADFRTLHKHLHDLVINKSLGGEINSLIVHHTSGIRFNGKTTKLGLD